MPGPHLPSRSLVGIDRTNDLFAGCTWISTAVHRVLRTEPGARRRLIGRADNRLITAFPSPPLCVLVAGEPREKCERLLRAQPLSQPGQTGGVITQPAEAGTRELAIAARKEVLISQAVERNGNGLNRTPLGMRVRMQRIVVGG